jgi:NADH dehydrogenase (ubiquinone) 1 alpha subcomplex subunit 13
LRARALAGLHCSVAKSLPPTVLSGRYLLLGCAVSVLGGFYLLGQSNIETRKFNQDKRERRAAIIPFLQAEEDVKYNHKLAAQREVEAKVMANVEGWEVGKSVYNTRTWMPPGGQRIG